MKLREGYGRRRGKSFKDGFDKRTEDGKEMEEEWKELKDRIIKTLDKMEGIRGNNRKIGWWNEKCRTEKAKVRRELRKWRRERKERATGIGK